jgi:hypothetical protein
MASMTESESGGSLPVPPLDCPLRQWTMSWWACTVPDRLPGTGGQPDFAVPARASKPGTCCIFLCWRTWLADSGSEQ